MNLTELRCKLKFLGWELKYAHRESVWVDPNSKSNNRMSFSDSQVSVFLNNTVKHYPNIGIDLDEILDNVLHATKVQKPP